MKLLLNFPTLIGWNHFYFLGFVAIPLHAVVSILYVRRWHTRAARVRDPASPLGKRLHQVKRTVAVTSQLNLGVADLIIVGPVTKNKLALETGNGCPMCLCT